MRLSEADEVSQDHCRTRNESGKLHLLNMCANTWLDGVRMQSVVSIEINENNDVWIGREAFCFVPVDARQFVIRRMIKDRVATVHFRAPKRRCFEEDDATKWSRTEIVDVARETEPMVTQPLQESLNIFDNKHWPSGYLERNALFEANNAYRKLYNHQEYKRQMVDFEIINSFKFNEKYRGFADMHHDSAICAICKNYPSPETVRRDKSKHSDDPNHTFCKIVQDFGTHIRCMHKKLLQLVWVEVRDLLCLQWNDEIFIRFERCARCGIMVSEYFAEDMKNSSCSHKEAYYQTSFESACISKMNVLPVHVDMNINGIQLAMEMVPIWMNKFIQIVASFSNFILDKEFQLRDVDGVKKIYLIIDWRRRYVIVGETCTSLPVRALKYRNVMRKVMLIIDPKRRATQIRRALLSINVPMCFDGNAFSQAFDSLRCKAFILAYSMDLQELGFTE